MDRFFQSIPIASERRVYFYLVDSTTLLKKPSVTISGAELQISKAGGNWASYAGTWTEISGTGNGAGGYCYEFTAGELDTPGKSMLKLEKSGVPQIMYQFEVEQAYFTSVVADGSNTASTFKVDRTESTNDYWKDVFGTFLTGSLVGQTHRVDSYNGTTKFFSFATGHVYTAAPSASDVLRLVNY